MPRALKAQANQEVADAQSPTADGRPPIARAAGAAQGQRGGSE